MITTESITSFTGDYRFLSNFWPCNVEFRGQNFPSAEHAYVAAKCDIYKKADLKALAEMTAGQVKRYGKYADMIENWDNYRYAYMLDIVSRKFNDNSDLGRLLIETGDALLVEGNTWGDTYWGVCKGKGQNNLGKILMKIREEIRSDYK